MMIMDETWVKFGDILYGLCRLPVVCAVFYQSAYFKRLERVQQLGLTSKHHHIKRANHTRFEHSRGVAYLAGLIIQCLQKNTEKVCKISDKDAALVTVAALIHDVGHGPWSHVFELTILPRLGYLNKDGKEWEHEHMSAVIVDCFLNDATCNWTQFGFTAHDFDLIKDLICGKPSSDYGKAMLEAKPWLFEIVANKRCGIDVDRLDYLLRDAHYTGETLHTDARQLLQGAKLVRTQDGRYVIGFHKSQQQAVFDFFRERMYMYKTVYFYREVKAIEVMVADALLLVEAHLGIKEKVQAAIEGDAEAFLQLDDTLVDQACALPDSVEGAAESKKLLGRVEEGDYYAWGAELVLPVYPEGDCRNIQPPTVDELCRRWQEGGGQVLLVPGDVVVADARVDCGTKERDPMRCVTFYEDDGSLSEDLRVEPSSFLQGHDSFEEHFVRFFIREDDLDKRTAKVGQLERALEAWWHSVEVPGRQDTWLTTPTREREQERHMVDGSPRS